MEFFDAIERYDLYPTFQLPVDEKRGLKIALRALFDDIDLTGARIVDVGAGVGIHSLYMASQGADVLALEPEASGATNSDVYTTLSALESDFENISASPITLQEFETDEQFDVVFMNNVVNHLDEGACKRLHESEKTREVYRGLFRDVFDITASGGVLLMTDCDRMHFYQYLGLDHPFMPMIEWEKHQPPSLWADLLRDSGFSIRSIDWTPTASFGPLAPLTSNYYASHLLRCHFRLVAQTQVTDYREPERNVSGGLLTGGSVGRD